VYLIFEFVDGEKDAYNQQWTTLWIWLAYLNKRLDTSYQVLCSCGNHLSFQWQEGKILGKNEWSQNKGKNAWVGLPFALKTVPEFNPPLKDVERTTNLEIEWGKGENDLSGIRRGVLESGLLAMSSGNGWTRFTTASADSDERGDNGGGKKGKNGDVFGKRMDMVHNSERWLRREGRQWGREERKEWWI